MASLLYQLGLLLLLVTAGPLLLLLRARHYLPTLQGRLGIALPPGEPGALWLHAVSVGEVAVASVVAQALPTELPLVVTTITPTGQARAHALLGGRAAVGYLPIDLGPLVERFLRRLRPAALVLVEGDYWPLLLARCRRRGLTVVVINGRVGDRTLRLLLPRPRVARWLMGVVERFAVQTEEDARRLRALGVAAEKVTVAGNLKYDAPEPPALAALEAAMRGAAAGRPMVVAGSTTAGEESAVIAAFQALGAGERALLVLAPRHPERWGEVARLLDGSGLAWVRRTAMEGGTRPAVVLLDSLGELASLYRLAAGCFVGGTLVPRGGHNPLEPARFGRAVAVGPSMENFRDMAAQFDEAGAWRRVAGGDDLAKAWRQWLDEPAAARALGQRALQVVEANRGALARTLEVLAPVIARAGSSGAAAETDEPRSAAPGAARGAAVASTARQVGTGAVGSTAPGRESLAAAGPAASAEIAAPRRARR